MRQGIRLIALAFLGTLTACADALPPGGVARLDGVYEGEATRSSGNPQHCPTGFGLRVTVTAGEAHAELFDRQQPDLPIERFMAFIEADGRVLTAVRVGRQSFGIQGRFGANAFVATAEGAACSLSAYAARKR